MYAPVECPICMDDIELSKNCVSTECGHHFHTSCLMKSVAHNGFGCPFCRTVMAEEPEESDDEEEGSEWSDVYEGDEEMFDDDALRGFRMFFNNLNGEPHDEEDVEAEENEEQQVVQMVNGYAPDIPSPKTVAEELSRQGYTFEDLVKIILHDDHEEYNDDPMTEEAVNRKHGEIFGKVRMMIAGFQEAQEKPDIEAQSKSASRNVDVELENI